MHRIFFAKIWILVAIAKGRKTGEGKEEKKAEKTKIIERISRKISPRPVF